MRSYHKILIVIAGALILGAISLSAPAWTSRHSRSNLERPLSKKQAKSLAHKLVTDLMKRMFFHEDELPRKVAISLFQVNIQNSEVNDKQFTDMVLNALLERSEVAIANIDPIMGDTLNYKLVSYDPEALARDRGMMMGAGFLITGSLSEFVDSDDKGRQYKSYHGDLTVKEIRTLAVLVEQKLVETKTKKPKRR